MALRTRACRVGTRADTLGWSTRVAMTGDQQWEEPNRRISAAHRGAGEGRASGHACAHQIRTVLLSMNLFADRDDSCAAESEGRKKIAQCASTGNYAPDGSAPERGVRIRARAHLSPRSGAG